MTKDGKIVTPKSDSILPSITRRSLCYVAEKYLGLTVEHRPIKFEEVKDFAECGLCGTAAVISPVGKIVDHGKEFIFPAVKIQSFNSLYALLSVKTPNLHLLTFSLKILSVQKSSNWQSVIVVAILLLISELTVVFIRLVIVLFWILPFIVNVSI